MKPPLHRFRRRKLLIERRQLLIYPHLQPVLHHQHKPPITPSKSCPEKISTYLRLLNTRIQFPPPLRRKLNRQRLRRSLRYFRQYLRRFVLLGRRARTGEMIWYGECHGHVRVVGVVDYSATENLVIVEAVRLSSLPVQVTTRTNVDLGRLPRVARIPNTRDVGTVL